MQSSLGELWHVEMIDPPPMAGSLTPLSGNTVPGTPIRPSSAFHKHERDKQSRNRIKRRAFVIRRGRLRPPDSGKAAGSGHRSG